MGAEATPAVPTAYDRGTQERIGGALLQPAPRRQKGSGKRSLVLLALCARIIPRRLVRCPGGWVPLGSPRLVRYVVTFPVHCVGSVALDASWL